MEAFIDAMMLAVDRGLRGHTCILCHHRRDEHMKHYGVPAWCPEPSGWFSTTSLYREI